MAEIGFGIVVALALAGLALLLAPRARAPSAVERRLADGDDAGPDLFPDGAPARRSLGQRLDAAFGKLVENAALDAAPKEVVAAMLLLGAGLAAGFYYYRPELWAAALGLALGAALPLVAALLLRGRRRTKMREQLPDMFFLLSRSVRAGLPLDGALAHAARENVPPLAAELRRAVATLELGRPMSGTLGEMARRTGFPEIEMLRSAADLHRRAGGNLPFLLERIAVGCRDRNQLVRATAAATALSRIGAGFIAAVQPALLVYFLIARPPQTESLFSEPEGLALVAASTALEIVGIVWLAWLFRRNR